MAAETLYKQAMRKEPLSGLPQAPAPQTANAMNAVRTDVRFSDPDWIFERKLDGIRCIAIRDASGVSLMSRTARRMNDQFPEIAEALGREATEDFVADGEVVAMRDGVSSFELLQQRRRRRVAV